jgi:hypothetical protein
MHKDNTPIFNVGDRKVVNFKDFSKDLESEKDALLKIKRQSKPNSERQKLIGNPKNKYNKVTHKMDWNLSPDMIKDKIDAIEELDESKIFETRIDDGAYHKLIKLSSYRKMVDKFREAINEFQDSAEGVYDDGDSDHLMAFASVIQDALEEAQ